MCSPLVMGDNTTRSWKISTGEFKGKRLFLIQMYDMVSRQHTRQEVVGLNSMQHARAYFALLVADKARAGRS